MQIANYVVGIDFGTDSVRTLIVDASDGREISSAVYLYPRWNKGLFCDPEKNQFRQHPMDYIEGLERTLREALKNAPEGTSQRIRGISADTTGSTPVMVDREGFPLALRPEFSDNPNAMFILWKDHTAVEEASEINELAHSWAGIDFTKYEGGVYSSEWFWAKILHVLRKDKQVRKAVFSSMEHCDWIPALLTGQKNPEKVKRSRCAAGHKAMWHASFKGLPSEDFLVRLDPLLRGLRERLYQQTFTSDEVFGTLSGEWAKRLGLSQDVVVGVGAFDAHMGAVGGGIEPYVLTKIIGTSTCDMLIAPLKDLVDKLIPGICGQVDGSIIPGMLGMEAGQSAVGDIYAWFRDLLLWPAEYLLKIDRNLNKKERKILADEILDALIPILSREAQSVSIDESGILAVDWMNGRRTPDANQKLKGGVIGLTLGSDAPKIFRALVEATAFGARRIVDRFRGEGVPIKKVIALGGVAKKSPFIMQVHSDIMNMPIQIAKSDQACALGAAMCAATAAGLYPSIQKAQKAMGSGFEKVYRPNPRNAALYQKQYKKYISFGTFIESMI